MIVESCIRTMNRLAHGARLCAGKRGTSRSTRESLGALRLVFDTAMLPMPFVESLRDPKSRIGTMHQAGRTPAPLIFALLLCLALPVFGQTETVKSSPPSHYDAPLLQCANLVYAGNQSSVCFSDHFLDDVGHETNLRVKPTFTPVRLDSDDLFNYPFCVMSGNDNFSLSQKERKQLRQYLLAGGFLLASPGCSDKQWDASFRQEIKLCFPEYQLKQIPMTHPIFSIVNSISRLVDKYGNDVYFEGLEINGRLVMVYSKEGLNDVAHAEGCCCCGGNEIQDPAQVNVNVFTYAALY